MNPINLQIKLNPELDIKKINILLKSLKSSLGLLGKDIKLIDENKVKTELSKLTTKYGTAGKKAGTDFANEFIKPLKGISSKVPPIKVSSNLPSSIPDTKGLVQGSFAINQMAMSMQMFSSALSSVLQPFIELDKQVKNIGTLGRENFEEFSQLATDLSIVVPDSAATIAEGVYQAISAGMGGTNQELMEFVEIASKAGVAGLSDTKEAVDGITSVLNAYGLSVDKASMVSDTFFGTIKLGKTTFTEMNSSLANFVPTAAALGVSFDQASAAIAAVTAQGTPTAQAGTQINGALLSILKGNAAMIKGLKSSGLTLKDLQEKLKLPVAEGGGLVNVLRDVKVASDKSGIALINMTGRAEGMKIIETLVGSQEKYNKTLQTYSNLTNEIAGGAANKAFEVAATGIEAQTAGFMSTVEAYFATAFRAMGDGAVGVASKMEKLMPLMMGFSALSPVFLSMGKGIFNLSGTLIQKLIPSLIATAAAQQGVEASTIGAAGAFKVLAKAMLTTPIGLIVTGITAAITAYAIFHKSEEEIAQDQLNEAKNTEDIINKQIKLNTSKQNLAKSNNELAKEYENLGKKSKRTQAEEERFIELHGRLARSYPGILGASKNYKENQKSLADAMGRTNFEAEKATVENKNLIKEYEVLGNKTDKTAEETERFEQIQQDLKEIFPDVIGQTKDWNTELNKLKTTTGLSTDELIGLQEEMDKLSESQKKATIKRIGFDIEGYRASIKGVLNETRDFSEKFTNFLIEAVSGSTLHSELEASLITLGAGIDKFIDKIKETENLEDLKVLSGEKLSTLFYGDKSEIEAIFGKGSFNLIQFFAKQDNAILTKTEDTIRKIIAKQKELLIAEGKIKAEKVEKKTVDEGTPTEEPIKEPVKTKTTAYQLARKQYDLDKAQTKAIYDKTEAEKDLTLAIENKSKSLENQIESQKLLIDLQIEDLKNAEALAKVGFTDKEIKAGAKKQLATYIDTLNTSIAKAKKKQLELEANIVIRDEKLRDSIKAGQFDKILLDVELGKISKTDFIKILDEIRNETKVKIDEIQEELDSLDVSTDLTDNEQKRLEELLAMYKKYVEEYNKLSDKKTEADVKQREETSAVGDVMKRFYKQLGDSAGETTVALINNQKDAGRALVQLSFDTLKALMPIFIAGIFGQSFSKEHPVLAAITTAIATAALYGLFAAARSSMSGAYEGDVVGRGTAKKPHSKDVYPYMLARDERIIDPKTSKQYYGLFEHISKGGNPLDYYSPNYYATGSGLLSSPELAIIGDNTKYSEIVMLEPQVEALGQKGANLAIQNMSGALEVMTKLQAKTIDTINKLQTRFYVLEKDIAYGVNKYNQKVKKREIKR